MNQTLQNRPYHLIFEYEMLTLSFLKHVEIKLLNKGICIVICQFLIQFFNQDPKNHQKRLGIDLKPLHLKDQNHILIFWQLFWV